MGIVTIAQQLGAGGGELAELLARRLGWRRIERELVERIARDLGVDPMLVERADGRVETFWERAGQYVADGAPGLVVSPAPTPFAPEQVFRATVRVLDEVAREGSVVIVGHAAQCVLEKHPDTLHVLVHADLPFRIARVRLPSDPDKGAVEEHLRRSDQGRQRYIRAHFQRDWMDAGLYDLCVDTGRIGIRQAAELVYSVRPTLR